MLNSLPQLVGIPIDNNRSEKIEASHSVMLCFRSSVTDFSLTSNTQSVFQSMMCLALVQANLRSPLHVSIKQPFNDEQCALDTADFPKGTPRCDQRMYR